jgi:hypothetical protein
MMRTWVVWIEIFVGCSNSRQAALLHMLARTVQAAQEHGQVL